MKQRLSIILSVTLLFAVLGGCQGEPIQKETPKVPITYCTHGTAEWNGSEYFSQMDCVQENLQNLSTEGYTDPGGYAILCNGGAYIIKASRRVDDYYNENPESTLSVKDVLIQTEGLLH